MKIKELIKELQEYDQEVEVFFKLETIKEDDRGDVDINWIGTIATSQLEEHNIIEIGLSYEDLD